jgi:hypothetical protein
MCSLLLGFWKLGWFKTLTASIRSCSLPCSQRGIPQVLAIDKSTSVRLGPRSEFLLLLPKVLVVGTAYANWLNHWLMDWFDTCGFPTRLGYQDPSSAPELVASSITIVIGAPDSAMKEVDACQPPSAASPRAEFRCWCPLPSGIEYTTDPLNEFGLSKFDTA